MKVTMALLADYANVSREGKLNVLGIFHQFNTSILPAALPQFQFVLTLEGDFADSGREHEIEIRCMSPSGQDLFKMEGKFSVRGGAPGITLRTNQILTINHLTFKEAGGHIFYVYLNNHREADVALQVTLRQEEQPNLLEG